MEYNMSDPTTPPTATLAAPSTRIAEPTQPEKAVPVSGDEADILVATGDEHALGFIKLLTTSGYGVEIKCRPVDTHGSPVQVDVRRGGSGKAISFASETLGSALMHACMSVIWRIRPVASYKVGRTESVVLHLSPGVDPKTVNLPGWETSAIPTNGSSPTMIITRK